jgi:hypothetical protein
MTTIKFKLIAALTAIAIYALLIAEASAHGLGNGWG